MTTVEEFFKALDDAGITAQELVAILGAIKAAGLAPERLTRILVASNGLVTREEFRGEEAAIRAKAAISAQEFETAAQEAHARFLAADEATQPQV